MCNLYSMTATVDELRRVFGPFDGDRDNVPPFHNIFPGKASPVLRRCGSAGLRLETMTWGFPNSRAGTKPVTNVRNLASPFWRSALKDPARRCLVPVTKFCEWTSEFDPVTRRKSKIWFGHRYQPVFAFAGIWRPSNQGPFMAFLTCDPNQTVGPVHPKAMPVVLDSEDYPRWLELDHQDACALAVPYADCEMEILP